MLFLLLYSFSFSFSVTDTWPGRGGHQMLVVHESDGNPYLWVIGGRGGDNTMNGGAEVKKYSLSVSLHSLALITIFTPLFHPLAFVRSTTMTCTSRHWPVTTPSNGRNLTAECPPRVLTCMITLKFPGARVRGTAWRWKEVKTT